MSNQPLQRIDAGLPNPLTPLIGRQAERATARQLLTEDHVRLLTLTGTGGVGKTRLALAVAADLAVAHGRSAHFVSLAAIEDAKLLLPAIAQALGLQIHDDRSLSHHLQEAKGDASLLLVLDNLEQLRPLGFALSALLSDCASLQVLATSRSPLNLRGEHVLPVPPLPVPDLDHLPDSPLLLLNDAVALFVQRAAAADPTFALTEENAALIAAICVQLDGLPLALELAAARLQVLSPAALLARLTSRLTLLTRGPIDVPDRHRSLRAAIAWSDELLTPGDRAIFHAVAVFAGGFRSGAAFAVTAAGDDDVVLLDALANLLDHGLLQRHVAGGEPRFSMLQAIREYALERLEEEQEANTIRNRHASYFLQLAESAAVALAGPNRGVWLERLAEEQDNLRSALAWLIDRQPEGALRFVAALGEAWYVRGNMIEGLQWTDEALATQPAVASVPRVRALYWAASLAGSRGQRNLAITYAAEALHLAREICDRQGEARAIVQLAAFGVEPVEDHYLEALEIARDISDFWIMGHILNNLAFVTLLKGDLHRAVKYISEAVELDRSTENEILLAAHLHSLGDISRTAGDATGALAAYQEAIILATKYDYRELVAECIRGLASVAAMAAPSVAVARLLGAAEVLRLEIDFHLPPELVHDYEQTLGHVRRFLGEEAFAAAWAEGQLLDRDQAITLATAVGQPEIPLSVAPRVSNRSHGLTPREHDVLRLLATGLTDREIANVLFISPHTASTHVKRLLRKFGVESRAAVAAEAVRRGLG